MKISYDLHIHSCLSPCADSDMTPNNIVNMASLLGLDAIAVSDHNSSLNLPAVFEVAKNTNLIIVPAIEVCTSEEVHMLCLFCTLDGVMAFNKEIYQQLPSIQNKEHIFGEQQVMDKNDCIIGNENKLLINAIAIGIDELIPLVKSYNGIAIPAHINRQSNSIISNLGFIPDDYKFSCVEIKDLDYKSNFKGIIIHNSDAHYLDKISQPVNFIEVKEKSAKGIINYLKGE